ncbi:hypothetical protein D3C87_1305740 [compost metagenome]
MGLDPIYFPVTLAHHFTNIAGADFFAAADHHVIGDAGGPVLGKGEGALQALTKIADAFQHLFKLCGALRRDQVADVFEQRQCGAFAGHFRGVGAHDPGAVTGQVHLGDAAAPGAIALWEPGAIERVPGKFAAEQVGELGFAAQAVGERYGIAVQSMFAFCVGPDQRLHPLISVDMLQGCTLMHRDAVGGQPATVVDAFDQRGRLRQQAGQGASLGAEG